MHRLQRLTQPGRVAFAVILLAGLLAVAPPGVMAAETFVVTNCDDDADSPVPGSLRAAIEAANNLPPSPDPHVVTFELDPPCDTIVLDGKQLFLESRLRVEGPGAASLAVSGGDVTSVISVADGFTVEIAGLTITGGNDTDSGGGIYNGGALTLTAVTVSGNTGGFGAGIANEGLLALNDSVVSGNTALGDGGGIYNFLGTVELINSTISGNEAGIGGAIFNDEDTVLKMNGSTIIENTSLLTGGGVTNHGTLIVNNSTFSGNKAGTHGGAVNNASDAEATITNSTISGNRSTLRGGGLRNFGTLTVEYSTISGNTSGQRAGGFENEGHLTLTASIVAGNTTSENGPDILGAVIDGGHNLLGIREGSTGLTHDVNGNIVGEINNPADPLLAPLAVNGGPTATHALLDGSPAIDHIPTADCAVSTDQRGYPRPFNGLCDIGAYELTFTSQACVFAGSLAQVAVVPHNGQAGPACSRGEPVLLEPGDDIYACLYAGSLTQVGGAAPLNCGRGTQIGLAAGDDLYACLYAGSLSQVGGAAPLKCGRGTQIGFARTFLPPTT